MNNIIGILTSPFSFLVSQLGAEVQSFLFNVRSYSSVRELAIGGSIIFLVWLVFAFILLHFHWRRAVFYSFSGAIIGNLLSILVILPFDLNFAFFIMPLIVGPLLIAAGFIAGLLIGIHADRKRNLPPTTTPVAAVTIKPWSITRILEILLVSGLLAAVGGAGYVLLPVYRASQQQSDRDDRVLYYVNQYVENLDNVCEQDNYFKDYKDLIPSYDNDALNQEMPFAIESICVSSLDGIGVLKCSDVKIEYTLTNPRADAPGTYEIRGQGDIFEPHYYEYAVVRRCGKTPILSQEEAAPKIEIVIPQARKIYPEFHADGTRYWPFVIRWNYQWIGKDVRVSLCPFKAITFGSINDSVTYSPKNCYESDVYPKSGVPGYYPSEAVGGGGLVGNRSGSFWIDYGPWFIRVEDVANPSIVDESGSFEFVGGSASANN